MRKRKPIKLISKNETVFKSPIDLSIHQKFIMLGKFEVELTPWLNPHVVGETIYLSVKMTDQAIEEGCSNRRLQHKIARRYCDNCFSVPGDPGVRRVSHFRIENANVILTVGLLQGENHCDNKYYLELRLEPNNSPVPR